MFLFEDKKRRQDEESLCKGKLRKKMLRKPDFIKKEGVKLL